jgi:glycosyltransferase involved in cell wall biosynthesis
MQLVSVIIPSHDRWDMLQRCVAAVHAQVLPPNTSVEIIVINDGSTDLRYTRNPLPGCTVIHLAQNTKTMLGFVSVGFVRNCGLRISRGDWVAFCDDDDVWLPQRLSACLATGAKAVCSDARVFWDVDHPAMPTEMMPRYSDRVMPRYKSMFPREFRDGFPAKLSAAMLVRHNLVIFSTLLVHRSVWRRAGVFNETRPFRDFFEDWDFVKRVAAVAHGIVYVDEPLIKYREHE